MTDTRLAAAPEAAPAVTPVPGAAGAARHRPFLLLAALLGGSTLVALGSAWELWYLPFLGGLGLGVLTRLQGRRARIAAGFSVLLAVGGWGAPLLLRAATGQPVGATARSVAALAGLPPMASLLVVVTLLLASVQALLGCWLGRTSTSAVVGPPTPPGPRP